MHALEVELLWARCLLGLGPPGTRTLTSLSPGSGPLAFLQQARESQPSAPSPMSTHLLCYSAYPVLSLLPVWGEKAALIFL